MRLDWLMAERIVTPEDMAHHSKQLSEILVSSRLLATLDDLPVDLLGQAGATVARVSIET